MDKLTEIIGSVGSAIGYFVTTVQRAATQTLEMVAKKVIPLLIFVSLIIGIINGSGLGNWLANLLAPMASSAVGLVVLAFICTIPLISPILAPGAVVAAIIGSLIGEQIGTGRVPVSYALPALYAMDSQVGCDAMPLAFGFLECEQDTMIAGMPAMLISRWVTGPVATLIAFVASIGMK